MRIKKKHFLINSFALSLTLKQTLKASRKWLIILLSITLIIIF